DDRDLVAADGGIRGRAGLRQGTRDSGEPRGTTRLRRLRAMFHVKHRPDSFWARQVAGAAATGNDAGSRGAGTDTPRSSGAEVASAGTAASSVSSSMGSGL